MGIEKTLHLGREVVEQVWERMNPNELPKLRQAPRERVLVIKGSYDNIEKILSNARIPYKLLDEFPDREDLQQGGRYSRSRVIFVNCDDSYHGDLEGKNLSGRNKPALREFVESGGRLVTTDWAQMIVRYLFGKLHADEDQTDDEVVKVRFSSDIGRKLSGVFYGNATPNWWLEASSDIVYPSKNSGIVELVESEELEKKYGSKHIAIGFTHGQGEVFHFVSHLIAQRLANYDKRDRQCISSFLDLTKTKLSTHKTSTSKIRFGEIETTYTLMNTVLELCRDKNILEKLKGGSV